MNRLPTARETDGVETWLWLDTGSHEAAWNMALDEVLLAGMAGRGKPLLRVYGWDRPSVSIGYFQPYPIRFEATHAIVRRPTGGGLVFHGEDLTFTFLAPPGHPWHLLRAADCYGRLHERIAMALRGMELPCELQQGRTRSALGVCFDLPVEHDLLLEGKKICGGAQRRSRQGLLHQGSLWLPAGRGITPSDLKRALRDGLGVRWEECRLTAEEALWADDLCRAKYATDAWNRRVTEARRSAPRPPAL